MGATWGTRLFTYWRGELVGEDQFGNHYYRDRRRKAGTKERRWVIYHGEPEASAVPPEWQGWLTHTFAEPPTVSPVIERSWQKEHEPNLTGTHAAYRPSGALERGGQRAAATGDYEPWTPNAN